jgi:hypothetical protein
MRWIAVTAAPEKPCPPARKSDIRQAGLSCPHTRIIYCPPSIRSAEE